MMDRWRNPDGTYNGIKMLSELSRLPVAEVSWTANRVKQLMVDQKLPKAEALAIVKEEVKARPWLKS